MSNLPSTIHFENLEHLPNKHQESTNELNSRLNGSIICSSFSTIPTSPSQRRNQTGIKKDNQTHKRNFSSSSLSDRDIIFQLQLEIGKLRQQLHLSDDSTTSTKNDITTATSFMSSTTTEEDELEQELGESISQTKSHEISLFQKENERLEHKNKRILQDLSMREKEVNALVARCTAQENNLKGLREVRFMGKEIEQLNEEMKRKDITVENLNEELTRTKKEAAKISEEVKEVGVLKCKEISILQNVTNNFTRENKSLGYEVAKLEANILSKDAELKESRSTIIIMTNSQLNKEEKLQSIHSHVQFLVSSIDKLKKDHSTEITTLKLEIDQLKTCSEKETIAFQQNGAKLEQLEKIVVARDETIEQQKQCHTEMEKELAEKSHLADETERQKKVSEDMFCQTSDLLAQIQEESQLRLQEMNTLKARYLQLQKDMKKEEDDHRKHVKNEVTIRQGIDMEMKAMKNDVMELKKQDTNNAELQKKCFYLEDKVERQENYLKKKLQQERRRKLSSSLQSSNTLSRRQSR